MEQQIKNNKITIKNVLSDEHFKQLTDIIMSDKFPWFYQNHVVHSHQSNTEEKYQIQFVHKFHEGSNIVTGPELWNMLFPIFAVLQPHTFLRVKANNIPGQNEIVTHGMHCDVSVPLSYTAIFYCNTNNGYTEFKDGDKVFSEANSMVIFPSYMEHTGSTCTDTRCRVNININFVASWNNQLLKPILPQGAEEINNLWSHI
jgi:hypothetical protein